MKPTKTIQKKGWDKEEVKKGVSLMEAHYMHVWKYHNNSFEQLTYAN
jgi:hypothetical protein